MTRTSIVRTFALTLLAALAANAAVAEPAKDARPAPPAVGQKAGDFALDTPAGDRVELSKLLAEGPVVVVVLRGWPGYQCPICTRQVGEFVTRAKDFEKAGARVVLIYPGPAEQLKAHAEEFAKGKGLPDSFRFVIDPEYAFTNQYGLRWNAKGETAYPSTFVLDRDGTVRFAHVSKSHGDRTGAAEALKALPAPPAK